MTISDARTEFPATFVVTAKMDDASFLMLDALRRKHFPKDLNFLSAHLTLFHSISEEQVDKVKTMRFPAQHLPLAFDGPVLLGRGVAVRAICPELAALRQEISFRIGSLTLQDSRKWMPHVTVQNKVDPPRAHALFGHLENDAGCRTRGHVSGLQIWRYLGGPWAHKIELTFGPSTKR